LTFIVLTAAELVARFVLGLGDPPLVQPDPQIEYLYKPSRSYHRFGNRIWFNSYSMRSDEFSVHKTDPREFRVMVIGDSIINGGAWTDQSQIATELLRQRLHERLDRPVVVGNISAASWGPPNELAYLKRFGLFDADMVIIVLGSEDYGDVPTFGPLGSDAPQHSPILALQEAIPRYVPQLRRLVFGRQTPPESKPALPQDIEASLDALRQMIDLVRKQRIPLAIAMHMERTEITSQILKPGYNELRLTAQKRDVPVIELGLGLAEAMNAGHEPFRDYVHPNAIGQAAMCDAMYQWIVGNLPAD